MLLNYLYHAAAKNRAVLIAGHNKKPTNWLGEAKRRITKLRPKAVRRRQFRPCFRTLTNVDQK